jgi:hypothetical protein
MPRQLNIKIFRLSTRSFEFIALIIRFEISASTAFWKTTPHQYSRGGVAHRNHTP